MDRCPSTCHRITRVCDIDNEEDIQPEVESLEEESDISYEEGDQLFVFDTESYLDSEYAKEYYLNRTNYDYVKKYDPMYGTSQEWTKVVPSQYHDYKDVFTKTSFDKLPEKRPWDHAIELTPGFNPTDCKNYALSPQEQKSLQEFIDENLRTSRICPSKSPMTSPFFFVKKKDGALRPTQDY